MPIRSQDPFHDSLSDMRSDVNRYLDLLRDGVKGSLPLLYGPSLKPWCGRWREQAALRMGQEPSELVLEIGSHYGEVILQIAREHPETAFVGIDITFKRVVTLAQKALECELRNLTSVMANAAALDLLFADGELDGVIIFFPDPWSKKQRQAKKRLLQPLFLATLQRKLKTGGYLWFKTDCEPYFSEVTATLLQFGWHEDSAPCGLPGRSYISRFERKFRDSGDATYAAVLRPPAAPNALPLPSATSALISSFPAV